MAAMPRERPNEEYKNLHLLSSAMLYNTARKSRGKFFKVDRIVEKRKFERVSNIRADSTKVIPHLI